MIKIHILQPGFQLVRAEESISFSPALEQEIAGVWRGLQQKKGHALYDGRIFATRNATSYPIAGTFVPYRYFAAQNMQPELRARMGLNFMAVSGLLSCPDGIVIGKRSGNTLQAEGKWELVPSGGIEGEDEEPPDAALSIVRELKEETGLKEVDILSVSPLCLIEDPSCALFDICFRIETGLGANSILEKFSTLRKKEHAELRIVTVKELKALFENGSFVEISQTLTSYVYP